MVLRKNILLFLASGFWLLTSSSFAQKKSKVAEPDPAEECNGTDEAKHLYEKSKDKKKYEYAERIKFLEEAVSEDPNYAPANYELGMHWQRRADESDFSPCTKCEQYFQAVIKNCPKFHSNPYFLLGKLYFEQEKYDTAVKYMKLFLNFKEDNLKKYDKLRYDRFLVDAKRYVAWANFYKEMKEHPVAYNPQIVEGVSTARDEYLPFITPDNELIFFTRVLPVQHMNTISGLTTDATREIFCVADRQANGKFQEGNPMPTPPFNINYHEGGATLTIDNKHLFYTVADAGGNY